MEHPVEIAELARSFDQIEAGETARFEGYARLVKSFQREFSDVFGRFAPFEFLPVRAFKDTIVTCFPPGEAEAVFLSSGTGSFQDRSRHYVYRFDVYRRAVVSHFASVFGYGPFTFLFVLPVDDRISEASSLIQMANILKQQFGSANSGFVLDEAFDIHRAVAESVSKEYPIVVFGTAFGLVDFVEKERLALPETAFVIETGGMKTHRREIGRDQLHGILSNGFGVQRPHIRSEYGMCELMSQFYTRDDMLFYPPPWVRFHVVDPGNPANELKEGDSGALAVFDLANMYSVSGILTEDRAVRVGDGFELLGRLSGAELRGCNFLMEGLG